MTSPREELFRRIQGLGLDELRELRDWINHILAMADRPDEGLLYAQAVITASRTAHALNLDQELRAAMELGDEAAIKSLQRQVVQAQKDANDAAEEFERMGGVIQEDAYKDEDGLEVLPNPGLSLDPPQQRGESDADG
ncbi:hypothetical protein BAY59_24395 [Prauserella coralliicola]|nr:hypothetical protein BAY59_24395 [Prauserella coralliicola]